MRLYAKSDCRSNERLNVRLRFRQAEDFLIVLPLPALFQQLDALEPFQDVAFRCDGAGAFKTAMLRHNFGN